MSKQQKLQAYSVWARLHLDVSVEIEAASLSDALAKAEKMDEHDFVKILGYYNDGRCIVYGVLQELPVVE